jgi:hypothetical protein
MSSTPVDENRSSPPENPSPGIPENIDVDVDVDDETQEVPKAKKHHKKHKKSKKHKEKDKKEREGSPSAEKYVKKSPEDREKHSSRAANQIEPELPRYHFFSPFYKAY